MVKVENRGGGVAAPAVAVEEDGQAVEPALPLRPGQGRVQIQQGLAQAHAVFPLAVPAACVAVAQDLIAVVHKVQGLGQIALLAAPQAVGDDHQPRRIGGPAGGFCRRGS